MREIPQATGTAPARASFTVADNLMIYLSEHTSLPSPAGPQMSAATETATLVERATTANARGMVFRYEQAVASHPPAGAPLTRRQQTEIANLQHWRRRLRNVTVASTPNSHFSAKFDTSERKTS